MFIYILLVSSRVHFKNVGVRFERQSINVSMNDILSFLQHLQFSNQKSSTSNCTGEVVNLNTEKLRNGNFYGIINITESNLTAKKFAQNFIFKLMQANKRFSKKITTSTSRVKKF